MDRARIVQEVAACLAGRRDIVAAYLFGSQARGEATPGSDVDVAVILAGGPLRDLAAIERIEDLREQIEARLRRVVDLVVMNGAAPDLVHRILRDGEIVHESDHRRRLEFEVQARNEYFDLLPILQLYRRTVLGSA